MPTKTAVSAQAIVDSARKHAQERAVAVLDDFEPHATFAAALRTVAAWVVDERTVVASVADVWPHNIFGYACGEVLDAAANAVWPAEVDPENMGIITELSPTCYQLKW